jgi:MerR family transcriptional regulator/heat shock protein HspR
MGMGAGRDVVPKTASLNRSKSRKGSVLINMVAQPPWFEALDIWFRYEVICLYAIDYLHAHSGFQEAVFDELNQKDRSPVNDELDQGDRALYSISVVTELTGVSQQALRGYEDKGLVTPQRTDGGTRRYSRDDIDHIIEIAKLLESGLNHEGVFQVMKLQAEADGLRQELREATGDER